MTKYRRNRIFRRPILRTSHKMAKTRRMMEAVTRMRPKRILKRL